MKNIILYIGAILTVVALSGCGSTVQPSVGSGEVNDKTLNGNTVDFFTFIRVQNNYGSISTTRESYNSKGK